MPPLRSSICLCLEFSLRTKDFFIAFLVEGVEGEEMGTKKGEVLTGSSDRVTVSCTKTVGIRECAGLVTGK